MPLVPKGVMFSDLPGAQGADKDQMMQVIAGAAHGGGVPMMPGGHIQIQYPGLRTQGSVDWQKVNPRLLEMLDKEAQKRQSVIVIQSGYRDHGYNADIGGHPTSSHKRGVAVDAFINGHPIGEVVGPDELAKLGIAVGGPRGNDPSHVELRGIPLKKAPQPTGGQGGNSGTASSGQQGQGLLGASGMDGSAGSGGGPPV
jgi:hypothetical protein